MKVCIWFGRCMGIAAAATRLLAAEVNAFGGDVSGQGHDELSVSNSNVSNSSAQVLSQIGGDGAAVGSTVPTQQAEEGWLSGYMSRAF